MQVYACVGLHRGGAVLDPCLWGTCILLVVWRRGLRRWGISGIADMQGCVDLQYLSCVPFDDTPDSADELPKHNRREASRAQWLPLSAGAHLCVRAWRRSYIGHA